MKKLSREEWIVALKDSRYVITFIKNDGSQRTILASLMESDLPPPKPAPGAAKREPDEEIVNFWSVDDKGWRSFGVDNVVEAYLG